MKIEITKQVIDVSIHLNEQEVGMLKELIMFAFDYEGVKPNSLYTSEKEFGKNMLDKLEELK